MSDAPWRSVAKSGIGNVANAQQAVSATEAHVVRPAPAHRSELRQVSSVVEGLPAGREAVRPMHRMHAQLKAREEKGGSGRYIEIHS
jgi:hypothetical protein